MSTKKVINENSPLEEIMEKELIKGNFNFKSQFTLFDTSKDKWNMKYALDFLIYGKYCKVAVECDGSTYHSSREAKEHDLKRDLWVKKAGIDDTLRFNTEEIKYNIEGVIKQIKNTIIAYDNLKENKNNKKLFLIKSIPDRVSNLKFEIIMKSISNSIVATCSNANNILDGSDRKKEYLLKETSKVIKTAGFADISRKLGFFKMEKISKNMPNIDILFGAYNIPCVILIKKDLDEVKELFEINNDPSILKIIIAFEKFEEKIDSASYVIFNATPQKRTQIAASDLMTFPKSNEDSIALKKLTKKAEMLELKLKHIYKEIYRKKSFREKFIKEPFTNLNKQEQEILIISLRKYLQMNKDKTFNKSIKSFDLAVEWIKSDGIYFRDYAFTLHDLTLTIQHIRNQVHKYNENI